MSRKDNHSQNSIKFSIWNTKTDKRHTAYIENSPESINKDNSEQNRKNS